MKTLKRNPKIRSSEPVIYQFKITLQNTKPPIWRRIQVSSDSTFWDLHVAIQDAMGWMDEHLHNFTVRQPRDSLREDIRIGIPDKEALFGPGPTAGWKVKINQWFPGKVQQMLYTYDFGDSWEHGVLFEKEMAREKGIKYPRCVAGKRACPPEDCGGPWGYERLLDVLSNPKDPDYEEMVEWIGDDQFDPEHFYPAEITFDDPAKRLKEARQFGLV